MPNRTVRWPELLWIVRHGESAGNLAWATAETSGHHRIDLTYRDVDIPLSPLGEAQAITVGRWFGALPPEHRPTVVLTSPFIRARETAAHAMAAANMMPDEIVFGIDERLREKEFGILDGLTRIGIQELYPEQIVARAHFGKFYYRPPGGESWCDVICRLRSLLHSVALEYAGERVLVVAHQVVVFCFRYLLEHMTEEQILAIDRAEELANCSVTLYEFDPACGEMALKLFNYVAPLEATNIPVTSLPDAPPAANSAG